MSDWQTCAVPDSLVKSKVGRQNQIPAKDIADVGQYPVVDQGQDFIAGYCDDVSKLITLDLPFIIFGDHTRCFKYVDFPFVLGADGTKILMPNKEFYYPKFYYYALLALEIPSRGYNRHFKSLKEQSLPLPRLSEQKKIAHILSTVQRAIEAQERIIQTTTELKKSLMHKLFTEGMRGEPRKQTEIGLMPESWEIARVETAFQIQQGKQISKKNRVGENQRPFLRTKNVFWNRLDLRELDQMHFSDSEEIKLKMKSGDILLCEGGDIGRTAMWKEEVDNCYHQNHLHRLRAIPSRIIPQYGVYWFWNAFELSKLYFGRGNVTTIPNLSQSKLSELPMAIPSLEEQRQISYTLDACEAKIGTAMRKVNSLKDLFRTTLHELMTAKIRVDKIDILSSEPTA